MSENTTFVYGKKNLIYISAIIFASAISFSYIIDYKINVGGDNAKYYLVAQSIADGKGYSEVWTPGEPPTSVYPPGYPLLLSALMIFTEDTTSHKILNGIFLSLSAVVLFILLIKLTDNRILSFSISIFTAINFHLLKFSKMIMSEASFVLFSALTLLFIIKLDRENNFWEDTYFWLSIICLSFSFHIRTQGITLVAGALLYFLMNKDWNYLAATAVGFFLLALPWRIRNRVQDLGASRYLDELVRANPWRPEEGTLGISGFVDRFIEKGSMLVAKGIPDSLFNFIDPDYQGDILLHEWLLGAIVLGLLFYGFWALEEYRFFFLGYFLATFVVVATWSATIDNRYMITIIPIMYVGLLFGIYSLAKPLLEKAHRGITADRAIPILFLVAATAMLPGLNELHADANGPYPDGYSNYFQIANEFGQESGCGDTVMLARKPALFHLFSGCHTVRYPFSKDDKKIISHMVEEGVDFVVLANLGFSSLKLYLYPAIKKNRDLFDGVMQKKEPDTVIFKFDIDKAKSTLNI